MNDLLKPFYQVEAGDLDSCSIKDEIDARGYLLIRKLMSVDDLQALLCEIIQVVHAAGWLLPGHRPLDRMANPSAACGDPDPVFRQVYEQVFNLEAFHALAHHARLRQVMNLLVGQQLLVHPKPIARLMFPNCERFMVHAHQDHQAIAGDAETFTAWMPLHDCPAELGPLQILEASHRFGLQTADPKTGFIAKESARGGNWVSGKIDAGDVLLFHSLTVHAASPNVSGQLRISMDCRFQDYNRALNPSTLVFAGSSDGKRSWQNTYAQWRSDELKYFWRRMPLRFKPSRIELAELAQSAGSPEMRARYARILNKIELEIPG